MTVLFTNVVDVLKTRVHRLLVGFANVKQFTSVTDKVEISILVVVNLIVASGQLFDGNGIHGRSVEYE